VSVSELAIVFACLAMGGILKGATGAGAPILAIPAMAMVVDVRFAVIIMLVPNLLTNLWQAWRFRKARPSGPFLLGFAGAGGIGAGLGSVALVHLPAELLSLVVALGVVLYIVLRLARPDAKLSLAVAERLSVPVGLAAGLLQGASGVSAPITLSFLNAMRLERPVFIATVSTVFVAMTALQFPSLFLLGALSWQNLLLSLLALLPISAFMPLGSAIAARLPREAFDRMILVLLALLAAKLMFDALTGA